MRQELVCGQIGWLAPVEDGLRDVRSEVAEADEPREVGWTDTFLLGQCGKRRPAAPRGVALKRCARISSLISRASGFAVENGSARSISILISRPVWRCRTGTD